MTHPRRNRVAAPAIESLEGRALFSGVLLSPIVSGARSGVKAVISSDYSMTITAKSAVHVNALQSVLTAGTPLTATYEWTFGDRGSSYNAIDAMSASHVYDTPGTYEIKLAVTDESGKAARTTVNVTVLPDTRRLVYVSKTGSDTADGSSPDKAVATVSKALALAGSNVEVLLQRGGVWDQTSTIQVYGTNVVLGAYGTGASPVLRRASSSVSDLILVNLSAKDVTIQDLTFDSTTPLDLNKSGAARGIRMGGTDIVIRNNTFQSVMDAINGELNPAGVLIQNNIAPTDTSIRAYFTWVQGTDWTLLGNTVTNSTREHIVRVGGVTRLTAEYNTFSNLDRTTVDSQDIAKGVFTIQSITYGTIAENDTLNGPSGIGPLSGPDGASAAAARTRWVVVRDNKITNGTLIVNPGVENALVVDNVISNNGGVIFSVMPTDPTKDATGALIYPTRNLTNLTISNNTGFNNSNNGRFLSMSSASNPGQLTLESNLYVAPSLETGYNQNAAVYIQASDLSSFKSIRGNIWPSPVKSPGNNGSAIYLWSSWWNPAGYLTASQWLSRSPVSSDLFSSVNMAGLQVSGSVATLKYRVTLQGITAGSRMIR